MKTSAPVWLLPHAAETPELKNAFGASFFPKNPTCLSLRIYTCRHAQIVYDQLKPLYDEAYHGLESVFQKLYQLSNGRRPDSAVPAPDILRGQDSV